eukprot:SAG22_NODE_29_length_28404_cov_23.294153_13_plen_225_part_00
MMHHSLHPLGEQLLHGHQLRLGRGVNQLVLQLDHHPTHDGVIHHLLNRHSLAARDIGVACRSRERQHTAAARLQRPATHRVAGGAGQASNDYSPFSAAASALSCLAVIGTAVVTLATSSARSAERRVSKSAIILLKSPSRLFSIKTADDCVGGQRTRKRIISGGIRHTELLPVTNARTRARAQDHVRQGEERESDSKVVCARCTVRARSRRHEHSQKKFLVVSE